MDELVKVKNLIPAPEDGHDGVTYEILPSVALIHADKDGNVLTGNIEVKAYRTVLGVRSSVAGVPHISGEPYYWVQYKVDSNAWTNCGTITIGSGIFAQAGYGVSSTVVSGITNGIAFRLVYGTSNSSYDVVYEIGQIPVVKDGQTGSAGAVGKFYYPAGTFDDDTPYTSTANAAPYVSIVDQVTGRTYYYMLIADINLVDGSIISPTDQEATGIWQRMDDQFKYLVSEMIFTNFAHLGSAVFCGDWMLSQYGTVNGSTSNQYQLFDPAYPNSSVNTTHTVNGESWTGYNFVPNYAVDLLRGKVFMTDAVVSGTIKTKSAQVEFADIRSLANNSMFVVGVDTTIGGNDITGIWNFKAGYHTIFLPTNVYAHYGQRVIVYNPYLGLGGANGTTIVCGEIDSNRLTTLGTLRGIGLPLNNNYGNIDQFHPIPGDPTPANKYRAVESIEFLNGVVELMCVPTSDEDQLCEWCVVNIGTNVFSMTARSN